MRKRLVILGLLLATPCCVCGNDLLFKLRGWRNDRAILRSIQQSDPAFAGLTIEIASIGFCYFQGELATSEQHERLRTALTAHFGERGASARMNVGVKPTGSAPN